MTYKASGSGAAHEGVHKQKKKGEENGFGRKRRAWAATQNEKGKRLLEKIARNQKRESTSTCD